MVIKIYISGISGLKEVKKRQQRVMMILESKHIPYDTIDITECGRDADKEFLQKSVGPTPDDKFPLTPQVFNEERYCGDYDAFDEYNEVDDLETFLGIEKMTPQQRLQNGVSNSQPPPEEAAEEAKTEEEPQHEEKPPETEPEQVNGETPVAESPAPDTEEPAPVSPVEETVEESAEPPPPAEEREEAEGASGDTVDESRGEAEGSEQGATQD